MSQPKITSLTPEQEALIPVYREKWRQIALSTEPIDKEKAAEVVTEAYSLIGKKKPHIIFCDSPYAVYKKYEGLTERCSPERLLIAACQLQSEIWNKLVRQLCEKLTSRITKEVKSRIEEDLKYPIGMQEVIENVGLYLYYITPKEFADCCNLIEFCISVLNLSLSFETEWILLQSLVKNCGVIYTYEEVAIICDRPRILSLDN